MKDGPHPMDGNWPLGFANADEVLDAQDVVAPSFHQTTRTVRERIPVDCQVAFHQPGPNVLVVTMHPV